MTIGDSTSYAGLAVVGFACLIFFGKHLRKQLKFLVLYRTTQARLGKHRKLAPSLIDDETAYPDQPATQALEQDEEKEAPWRKRRPRRERALEQEEEEGGEGGADMMELAGAADDGTEDDDDEEHLTAPPIAPIAEPTSGRRPRGREQKKPVGRKSRAKGTKGTKGKFADGHMQLCVELPDGSKYEISLDISDADSMQELQILVIEQWKGLGGSQQDGLMMQFMEREGGEFQKVTRSTTIATLQLAWALSLKAKYSQPACSTCASSFADHVRPSRTRAAPGT